jgi:hypothetical protein
VNDQLYHDDVLLEADTQLDSTSGDVTFEGFVDAASDAHGLVVNTPTGHNRFEKLVGTGAIAGSDADGLAYLATDVEGGAGGQTQLAAPAASPSVKTVFDQSYGDSVLLEADQELVSRDGDVIFWKNVEQAGGPHALTVLAGGFVAVGGHIGSPSSRLESVRLESNTDGNGLGDVAFFADGDQGVYASEEIALNTNRAAVPDVATIYKVTLAGPTPGNLTLDAGDSGKVTMGLDADENRVSSDKLTVPNGNLLILAQNATVGDLNALKVTIGGSGLGEALDVLTVNGRVFAPVLLADGTTVIDNGVEIIGNEVMIYTGAIQTVNASGPVVVGTPDGLTTNLDPEAMAGQFLLRAIFPDGETPLTPADMELAAAGDPIVLDIVARGPGFGPLDVIPYVPTEEEKNPSGVANRAAVAERPLRPEELLSFFDCMSLTEDQRFQCEEQYVGAERAASPQAEKLRALAADLFEAEPLPAVSAAPPSAVAAAPAPARTPEERDRRILQAAVDDYQKTRGAQAIDGPEFRRYLETTAGHEDALAILDRYGELLSGVREFGATDEAYEVLKATKLQRIAPRGLSVDALGEAVEAGLTAWPVERGVRVASSDRYDLFQGLESKRLYLVEKGS